MLKEVDKLKQEKQALEALTDASMFPKEKTMTVCDVCGALQSTTDTDKRLIMHLEGKLHTGYLKVRKVLSDLKAKREMNRRSKKRKSRSRSPALGNNKSGKQQPVAEKK